jgi:hypothetical protein
MTGERKRVWRLVGMAFAGLLVLGVAGLAILRLSTIYLSELEARAKSCDTMVVSFAGHGGKPGRCEVPGGAAALDVLRALKLERPLRRTYPFGAYSTQDIIYVSFLDRERRELFLLKMYGSTGVHVRVNDCEYASDNSSDEVVELLLRYRVRAKDIEP